MRGVTTRSLLLSACALWLSAACEKTPVESAAPAQLPTGHWSAVITVPGGQIETAFEIRRTGDTWQATLINGQERFPIDEVSFEDEELALRFTVFNNEIRARLSDGKLEGEVILVKLYGREQVLPFRAIHGAGQTKTAAPREAAVDMSGRWAVTFIHDDGSTTPSIGEFAQRGSRLFGTFINVDGDHRYLAGHVEGNEFKLSTFDGAHAYLFTGTVKEDRIVHAGFWSGTDSFQNWSARRDPQASLPDTYALTRLNPIGDELFFEFPNHEGKMVSLDDQRYDGKVIIVNLAGTWCPNCNDEARFLSTLHSQFHQKGLEIISLMFEHFEDQELAARQIEKYRAKHKIQYETLIAGISDKVQAARQLPALDTVWAFPTTIFVDRNHRVRTIHTGFSGPGTGSYHEKLKQEFTALVNELIGEQQNLTGSGGEQPASGK